MTAPNLAARGPRGLGHAIFPLVAGLLFTGCSFTPPPVPVQGRQADVTTLEGTWAGDYHSPDSGRSGSIQFRLVEGTDTATGHVLMIPAGGPPHEHPEGVHPPSEFIDISFVRVVEDRIEGRLEPYRDPACGCRVRTTFFGTIEGDAIMGTFETVHLDGGRVQRGEWRVVRRSGP